MLTRKNKRKKKVLFHFRSKKVFNNQTYAKKCDLTFSELEREGVDKTRSMEHPGTSNDNDDYEKKMRNHTFKNSKDILGGWGSR